MAKDQLNLFTGPSGIRISPHIKSHSEIVPLADALSGQQKRNIMQAFEMQAYEMGTEFVWKRAMIKLRGILKSMGMKFIGEMLERSDIDEFSSIEQVLTDYETIQLAEQLSVISPKGAMKLRHNLEILIHYFDDDATEESSAFEEGELEMEYTEGVDIVKTCIKYILGEKKITVPISFSEFRNRVLGETIPKNDPVLEIVETAPPFQISTVLSILLNAIKENKSPTSEHAVDNLNLFIPKIWEQIGEREKYKVGETFRDVTAAGITKMAVGLRSALLKVKGFDYVPENLRSKTFRKAAREVVSTHFAFHNFYNEPRPTRALSELGSKIPDPAFPDCIRAYLCVYLGNKYNICREAAEIAEEQLIRVTEERWRYFFEKLFLRDEVILKKLTVFKPRERWRAFLKENDLHSMNFTDQQLDKIFQTVFRGSSTAINRVVDNHISALKKVSSS